MSLRPLPPVYANHLLREVDEALVPLLRGLEPTDWAVQAVGRWEVRDVVAHLLDGALRRLSLDRDRHRPPATDRDLSQYGELVEYLNDLNAVWIEASRRLSPGVMIDLLEHVCPQVADYFDSLDPEAEAAFPVSWAGTDVSRVWMDVAREFSERWHHQQQIREAVGAPGLDQARYGRPLLETFVRALPRSYASFDAPDGTRIEVRVNDLEDASWSLERRGDKWTLGLTEETAEADTKIEVTADTACRLFTKGVAGPEAEARSRITGERDGAEPFFRTLAIMA